MPHRDALITRLANAITVSDARRAGDPETRVRLDHYMPSPGAAEGSFARWRLYTAGHRLIGVPSPEAARSAWHRADAAKGRRLIAADLRNANRALTVAHGRIGLVEDSGIALTPDELDMLGFAPGVGERNGGWADGGYRERRHPV
jgi:hypothetical protein